MAALPTPVSQEAARRLNPHDVSVPPPPLDATTTSTFPSSSSDAGTVLRVYTAAHDSADASGAGSCTVVLLVHGAGHAALSWSLAVDELMQRRDDGAAAPLLVVVPDLRGHGHSAGAPSDDLGMPNLKRDALAVLRHFLGHEARRGRASATVYLVGHSLGGAVAANVAAELGDAAPSPGWPVHLGGLVLLDAVQGTAVASLAGAADAIRRMPTAFDTVDEAVRWVVDSGAVRNPRSAELSTPPRLVRLDGGERWGWRCDLLAAHEAWPGWFMGLDELFLGAACRRLLVVSDVGHLDEELSLAHMQGKFQLRVLPQCGHAIHEDAPGAVATLLAQLILASPPRARAGVGVALPR